MGGKTSTSTSQVQIPPEVLARYNSVNATAENVAQTPFQPYSSNPSAFVQPLTPTQQAGIQNTNSAAGMAQPYFQAGTGFALAGSQPINAQPLDTSSYMNPYLGTVLGSTEAMINQQNQQAMAGQTGNAINQGYFGGDRSGIAAAVLQGQQNLAAGQVYSGIASDAYNQALAAAQQQQGVQLGAAQANRQALQQTGQTLAGLGTGAQGAAIQGAQAQLGAGQVEQQTGQAGLTALYNQFLQQQSYPFQTAQFLANIAEGTGALSGSTTATTQPQSIFSDERLKEDIEPIGKGFDGANIIRFRYRGDPTTRIGMSAQEVERRHPEAITEHGGFKAIDYGAATDEAAGFGRAANDNGDDEPGFRAARQAGGMSGWGMYPSGTNPMVIQQLLESQAQMYAPYSGQGGPGLYGHTASEIPHGGQGYVPAASLPVGQLQVAHPVAAPQSSLGSDIHQAASFADDAEGLSKDYHFAHQGFDKLRSFLTGQSGSGGGGGDGGDDVNKAGSANGGRIARAPGGLTAADYAAQAHRAASEAKIHAAAAAAHRDIAVRNAQDRAAAQPDTSFGGRGSVLGATGLPQAYHGAHVLADATYAAQQGLQHMGQAAAPYVMSGMAGLGNLAANVPWTRAHPAGWKPTQPYVTDPNAYRPAAAPAAAPPAAAPAARPGAPPPATAPGGGGSYFGSAADHALRAAQHAALARHHAAIAQSGGSDSGQVLSAPTAAPTGQASPNLAGAAGIGLPTNTGAPVIPMNIGDVSHLQGGFAPANLQPYHEDIFHRIGDWLGGHFGSDAQREAYDARGPVAAAPIQSEAFQGRTPTTDAGLTHEQWLAGGSPAVAAAPPADNRAPVVQSEAFQAPKRLVAPDGSDLASPVTLATGGFARAGPRGAEVSGPHNTDRVARDLGGGTDPSNPQDDNPYKPQGPGLNIPTAETQHAKLATAAPPTQGGGGGLGSAIGMGSDLVNIAKFALPFFGVPVKTGGRIGYADGGDPPDPDDPTAQPVKHDPTATPVAAAAADDAAPPPPPAKQPGLAAAAQPGHGGGFGGALASLIGAPLHLLGEAAGYEGNGKFDRDRLMPFLSAIGTMGATPTVHPLFALSQGLGAYGKSYMDTQRQEADIAQENANAQLARFQAQPLANQSGYMEMPGAAFGPDGMSIDWSRTRQIGPNKYVHLGDPSEEGPGGGTATAAPGLASAATIQGGHAGANAPALPSRGPMQVNYDHGGAQTWAPSETSDAQLQSMGLHTEGGPGAARANRLLINRNQGLQGAEAAGQQVIATNQAGQADAVTNARNLRMLGQAINSIPPGGIAAMGENYEGRQQLVRIIQTARRMVGLPDDEALNADMTPADIVAKINTLASTSMAHATGQHSADIANALKSILPGGGSSNFAAANHIIAGLMVQNQQALDFGHFANAYLAKYGTSIGVQQAFQDEMNPVYGQDQPALERMMARSGRSQSMAEYLQAHPDRLKDFEQGVHGATGLGMGIGRYWPGGV